MQLLFVILSGACKRTKKSVARDLNVNVALVSYCVALLKSINEHDSNGRLKVG